MHSPKEIETVLQHHIATNKKTGKRSSISISGPHGIGKTEMVIEIGKKLGYQVVKRNLAQFDELADFLGYPIVMYEVGKKTDKGTVVKWVEKEDLDHFLKRGWLRTKSKPQMSYAIPEWIDGKGESGILLLDDWTRADQRFIQACMDLIKDGEYASWKLPEDWHIILTENPDNGDYNVSDMDGAQKDRYFVYNMKFDVEDWAVWAEEAGIDSRCINFMLTMPEATSGVNSYGDNSTQDKLVISPRAWTSFFNVISSFDDFGENLGMVRMIAEGKVGEDAANMFINFINQKMDKWPSPKEILLSESGKLEKLKELVKSGDEYRSDIASTLSSRIVNFCNYYLKSNSADKDLLKNLKEIILSSVLTEDLKFHITRSLHANNRQKLTKLFVDKDIINYVQ